MNRESKVRLGYLRVSFCFGGELIGVRVCSGEHDI